MRWQEWAYNLHKEKPGVTYEQMRPKIKELFGVDVKAVTIKSAVSREKSKLNKSKNENEEKPKRITVKEIKAEFENQTIEKQILKTLSANILNEHQLSKLLQSPEETIHETVTRLISEGYNIIATDDGLKLSKDAIIKAETTLIPYYEQAYRFGIVSDTHAGSIKEQLTNLNLAYDIFHAHGISEVYNAGDMTAGIKMYKGQEFEVHQHGADKQRDWTIKNYPQRKGIKTYAIAGNHDGSFLKEAGYDIVRAICKDREDLVYCGFCFGQIALENGLRIELLHPDGGVPYAQSYRSQKINEARGRGEDIPHITLYGHMHISLFNPYLDVYDIMCGCFEGQTTYEKRKGLLPQIGCWIIEVTTKQINGKPEITRIYQEWIPFKEIPNDFKNYK